MSSKQGVGVQGIRFTPQTTSWPRAALRSDQNLWNGLSHQSTLPFGPEAVQGSSERLHRSPQAGWEEREGILQTGSSLQGTQGKRIPTKRHLLRYRCLGPWWHFQSSQGGVVSATLCHQGPRVAEDRPARQGLKTLCCLSCSPHPVLPHSTLLSVRTINPAVRTSAASCKLSPGTALHRSCGRKLTRT